MTEWFRAVGLMDLTEFTIFVRLALAVIMGGILGFERTRKMRAAGLRTYMLVCVGATMAMMTGEFVYLLNGNSDPARIAAQVISGIGFLGAGTIMMSGYHRIKGLTTAAGLWVSACMGLAIGIGFYAGAVIMMVVILVSMVVGEKLQDNYLAKGLRMRIYVLFDHASCLREFLVFLRLNDIVITDFENTQPIGECVGATFILKVHGWHKHLEVLDMLREREGVAFLEEI